MNIHKWQLGFFIGLVIIGLVLSYHVIKPYLDVLFLVAILTVVFYPLYVRLLKIFSYPSAAAAVSVVLVIVVVLIPLTFFGFLVFQEATDVYQRISSGDNIRGVVGTLFTSAEQTINNFLPNSSINLENYIDITGYSNRVLNWLIGNTGSVVTGILRGVFSLFLLVLALFYSFKDGHRLVNRIVEISPLKDAHDQTILDRMQLAVNTVIKGYVIIAIIQGILAGVGLWIFNVPNPAIWGFVAALASFIPTVGTGLVLLPAVIFLLVTGQAGSAVGLVIWGMIAVGLVDNLLGPYLIERGIKIHPFLILIFVLGGIEFFGPIGFIAGPVLLSVLFAIFDIYPMMIEAGESKKA